MYLNLIWLFVGHFAIDLTSSWAFFRVSHINIFLMVIIYNSLAFGLQWVFGLLIDKWRNPKLACAFGLALALIGSLFLSSSPVVAITLIGLANAIFHIGIGITAFHLTPHKAAATGFVVASGALGLLSGKLMTNYSGSIYFVVLFLLLLFVSLNFIKQPELIYYKEKIVDRKNIFILAILLLLMAIIIRSFIGLSLVVNWQTNVWSWLAVGAIFFGKAFGGLLADKFGWIKTAFLSLFLSSFAFLFGGINPYFIIIGLFLFNIPMSITLVGLAETMPRHPGLAFGLNCLALLIGFYLVYFKLIQLEPILTFSFIIIAIITISSSLMIIKNKKI